MLSDITPPHHENVVSLDIWHWIKTFLIWVCYVRQKQKSFMLLDVVIDHGAITTWVQYPNMIHDEMLI